MQKLVNLIEKAALKYTGELFYADGEFFAMYDGKVVKLPDFSGEFRAIYKLTPSTENFITSYIENNSLDAEYLAESLKMAESELELYESEIPDGLDYDSFNYLISCDEAGIMPYNAYMALKMIAENLDSGVWMLLDRYGEYKSAIQYISDGCELIDFAYTDENDDEYWESIITNLESYIFSGGEIF